VISAPKERLKEVKGLSERGGVAELKIVQAAAGAASPRGQAERSARCCRHGRTCSTIAAPPMAFAEKGAFFRILFLDKRNQSHRRRAAADGHRRSTRRSIRGEGGPRRALELSRHPAVILVHKPPHSRFFGHASITLNPFESLSFIAFFIGGLFKLKIERASTIPPPVTAPQTRPQ